ncbi:helix-turn-helix domain-containing protein [Winogradskyella ouciana]|uniref:Helix-turn-helix domain-containing protein n=1 Tax=Winogradskyella ouciana TaxID=2608631 RepID=A0A7K1G9X9_9FLAO|nr:AraC family transcriptional regulator [Winogradskyella ouciana]MTE25943.1 helix-turn-helix domain-containing protein [Winogradskyella ouciana]
MTITFKFNYNKICNTLLEEKLKAHHIEFQSLGNGEVEILGKPSEEVLDIFYKEIHSYGIDVVENPKLILVQKIKDLIKDLIFNTDISTNVKTSVYLAEALNKNYSYLASIFSEITYTSIENYIILQKIEYAKTLIIKENLTLTEIAHKLNYSSVAHLSRQFKNTTGITPSAFERIILMRKKEHNHPL